MKDDIDHQAAQRSKSLGRRQGLTNGEVASSGMEVDVGLINGLPNEGHSHEGRGLGLIGRSRRRRRAVREAMERKARAPLPGADGEEGQ